MTTSVRCPDVTLTVTGAVGFTPVAELDGVTEIPVAPAAAGPELVDAPARAPVTDSPECPKVTTVQLLTSSTLALTPTKSTERRNDRLRVLTTSNSVPVHWPYFPVPVV
jgi:hypothetical protein